MGWVVRAALFGAAAALVSPRAALADDRFTVCSVTINSDDEIELLRRRLPATDFRFVELTDSAQSSAEGGGPTWIDGACQSGIRCDVLVVSGHFGNTWAGNYGTTFAGTSGKTLALDDLERHRCDQSCSGILGDPLEVFLFGCKTLAEADARSLPAADVQTFARQHVPPAAAERVLDEARNDGETTSSRDRMRFVFAGVPRLYGFTDVAPSGKRIAPFLESYLDRVGDYAAHLRRLRAAKRAERPAPANEVLARSLESTCFAQSEGLAPAGPEALREGSACRLRDRRRPLGERLRHVERLLDAPDFVTYLPAVDSLLRTNRGAAVDGAAVESLARIRAHERARGATLALMRGLESPLLRLETVRVARSVGWMTADDALPVQREIVSQLLRPPVWGEGRDFICGMGDEVLSRIELSAEDVPAETYQDEFGIQALGCLKPADPRIRERLARSLLDSRAWIARLAAKALRRMGAAPVTVGTSASTAALPSFSSASR